MSRVVDDITATGEIRDGKLFIRNRREFDQALTQMRDGLQVEIAVTRLRATRSPQANAYYWGVVLQALSDHTGYTVDELHDICKAKCLPKKLAVNNGNGEVVGEFILGGSTRKLDTTEFYEYVERVRQWAAELDCYIPDPNEATPLTRDWRDDDHGEPDDEEADPIYRWALTGGK